MRNLEKQIVNALMDVLRGREDTDLLLYHKNTKKNLHMNRTSSKYLMFVWKSCLINFKNKYNKLYYKKKTLSEHNITICRDEKGGRPDT